MPALVEASENGEPKGAQAIHRAMNLLAVVGRNNTRGIRLKERPVFSVQYHPEASAGPHDSHYLFDEFRTLLAR